jgi:hypothetical protein
LIVRTYCKNLGLKTLLVPDYFSLKTFKVGVFEPFNVVSLYLQSKNGFLQPVDILSSKNNAPIVSGNYARFEFMSKVSRAVLRFVKFPDAEIFDLLNLATEVEDFFNFNYIRFLLNFSKILGFSVEKINRAGWVNIVNLKGCSKEEIGKGYCIFIPPKGLFIIKRTSKSVKPFEIPRKEMDKLEKFFGRFLKFQTENF